MSDYLKILAGPQGNPPVVQIAELINQILKKFGHSFQVSSDKLTGGPKAVWEKADGPLYSLMVEQFFPAILGETEVYHFTSRKAVERIFGNSPAKLRLTSMTKRVAGVAYDQGELTDFLGSFGFPQCTAEKPNLDQMAASKFYTSFAKTNLTVSEEQSLWDCFAKKDGARLKFKVSADSPFHFKEIKYDKNGSGAAMFREINEALRAQYGYQIVFKSWSTFIGFYLGRYMHENECRLLLDTQQNPAAIPCIPSAPEYQYFEIEIGSASANPKIELLEVISDLPIPGVTARRRTPLIV